eukprot:SAG31_NODE_302_length_18087_cov_97.056982_10_plen_153_part_00
MNRRRLTAWHLLHGEKRRVDVAGVEAEAAVRVVGGEVALALSVKRRARVRDRSQGHHRLLEPAGLRVLWPGQRVVAGQVAEWLARLRVLLERGEARVQAVGRQHLELLQLRRDHLELFANRVRYQCRCRAAVRLAREHHALGVLEPEFAQLL